MSVLEIISALAAFDGMRVAPLRAAIAGNVDAAGIDVLIDALHGPDQIAASWMLKALVEKGALPGDRMTTCFAGLAELTEPVAILHILQMVQFGPEHARPFREAMVPLARHSKLLVKIWAFDAYCRTTPKGEEGDRDARIRAGLTHRSKAMQARARNLAREFGMNPAR